jgi:hypothetical protein
MGVLTNIIDEAMEADASEWNQRQRRNAFIKITMNVSKAPREVILPVSAADPMRLKISCEKCACQYAVVGSAFFCPACGTSAAEHVFRQSLSAVRASVASLPAVRASVSDADTAENLCRLILEAGLQNVVMAFQRFAEALYERHSRTHKKPRRNAFQNLDEGSDLWKEAFGTKYDVHLSEIDLSALNIFFQQRHLLAHLEGIIDQKYIEKSGDTRYLVGQRIVLRQDSVLRCLELTENLARGMAQDAGVQF